MFILSAAEQCYCNIWLSFCTATPKNNIRLPIKGCCWTHRREPIQLSFFPSLGLLFCRFGSPVQFAVSHGKLACTGMAEREELMETISWVGPSARKLVGESHQPNHTESLGVAVGLRTSLGFVPALLPRAVWLMVINGKVSAPSSLHTQVVPLCSCF